MPDEEPNESTAGPVKAPAAVGDRLFSAYGIASTVLGVLAVVAVITGALIFAGHRGQVAERHHQSRVLQAAVDWTGVLINMNTDNVDASLRQLHEETVGQLNVEFDSTVAPYRQVVQKVKSHSTGQIEAVAIESVHESGAASGSASDQLPSDVADRTDTAMVIATSEAGNAGGKPRTVHWNLRLDVADVDGKLMISGLGSIK